MGLLEPCATVMEQVGNGQPNLSLGRGGQEDEG